MRPYLTFAMVAPLSSFGAIAVGDRREGWDRPARSAVLGLIGACLGLTRDDEDAQALLGRSCGLAVLCHEAGRPMTDYHTVQNAPPRRNWRPATRAAEFADMKGDADTILTRRDYRMGAWHLGALWARDGDGGWPLETIASAMRNPVFVPSIGRKSCPAGLPLAPDIATAPDAVAALRARHANGPEARFRTSAWCNRPTDATVPLTVVMDAADYSLHGGGASMLRRETRRDEPLSRTRWQFGLREEAILRCEEARAA